MLLGASTSDNNINNNQHKYDEIHLVKLVNILTGKEALFYDGTISIKDKKLIKGPHLRVSVDSITDQKAMKALLELFYIHVTEVYKDNIERTVRSYFLTIAPVQYEMLVNLFDHTVYQTIYFDKALVMDNSLEQENTRTNIFDAIKKRAKHHCCVEQGFLFNIAKILEKYTLEILRQRNSIFAYLKEADLSDTKLKNTNIEAITTNNMLSQEESTSVVNVNPPLLWKAKNANGKTQRAYEKQPLPEQLSEYEKYENSEQSLKKRRFSSGYNSN